MRGSAGPGSPGRRRGSASPPVGWASPAGYGMRWMVEAFFSAVKRKFGEGPRARSAMGLPAGAMGRLPAHDLMRSYALARTGAPM